MKRMVLFFVSFMALISYHYGQVMSRPRIVEIPRKSEQKEPQKTLVKPLVSQQAANLQADASKLARKTVESNPSVSTANLSTLLTRSSLTSASAINSPTLKSPEILLKNSLYDNRMTFLLLNAIESKIGLPYRYGSDGPTSYDCSGFIWSIFRAAGIDFERTSARNLWLMSEPVSESEKYKFGTLVFFNRLGHVGIVVDENGFYHASRTKGITYSPFAGYWQKRIVGFRKLKLPQSVQFNTNTTLLNPIDLIK